MFPPLGRWVVFGSPHRHNAHPRGCWSDSIGLRSRSALLGGLAPPPPHFSPSVAAPTMDASPPRRGGCALCRSAGPALPADRCRGLPATHTLHIAHPGRGVLLVSVVPSRAAFAAHIASHGSHIIAWVTRTVIRASLAVSLPPHCCFSPPNAVWCAPHHPRGPASRTIATYITHIAGTCCPAEMFSPLLFQDRDQTAQGFGFRSTSRPSFQHNDSFPPGPPVDAGGGKREARRAHHTRTERSTDPRARSAGAPPIITHTRAQSQSLRMGGAAGAGCCWCFPGVWAADAADSSSPSALSALRWLCCSTASSQAFPSTSKRLLQPQRRPRGNRAGPGWALADLLQAPPAPTHRASLRWVARWGPHAGCVAAHRAGGARCSRRGGQPVPLTGSERTRPTLWHASVPRRGPRGEGGEMDVWIGGQGPTSFLSPLRSLSLPACAVLAGWWALGTGRNRLGRRGHPTHTLPFSISAGLGRHRIRRACTSRARGRTRTRAGTHAIYPGFIPCIYRWARGTATPFRTHIIIVQAYPHGSGMSRGKHRPREGGSSIERTARSALPFCPQHEARHAAGESEERLPVVVVWCGGAERGGRGGAPAGPLHPSRTAETIIRLCGQGCSGCCPSPQARFHIIITVFCLLFCVGVGVPPDRTHAPPPSKGGHHRTQTDRALLLHTSGGGWRTPSLSPSPGCARAARTFRDQTSIIQRQSLHPVLWCVSTRTRAPEDTMILFHRRSPQ